MVTRVRGSTSDKFATFAALPADLGSVKIGDVVETVCHTNTASGGGNTFELVDGVSSRPAEDNGSVKHVSGGSGFLYWQGLFPEGVNLLQFGADPSGTTSIDTIAATVQSLGYRYTISTGTYLTAGINIITDGYSITFDGDVTLKAASNGAVLFRQASSECEHSGYFKTDSNGKANVWGMAIAPVDLTQTTTLVDNSRNKLPGIVGDNGLAELIIFQCGPDVGGSDSGCFYNKVPFAIGNGAVRNVWFKDPPNAGGSTPNGNKIYNMYCGTSSGVSSNCGVYIEGGVDNEFYACDFEGIGSGAGRAGPLATETAIYIANTSPMTGASNNRNKFYGGRCEANTRDLENLNPETEFYGLSMTSSKMVLTALPRVMIGGGDPSIMPTIVAGILFQTGSLPAYANYANLLGGRLTFPITSNLDTNVNTLDDYREGTFTPTITATGMSGQSYSVQKGVYQKVGNTVHFSVELALSALTTPGGNYVKIQGLPFTQSTTTTQTSYSCLWDALTGGAAGNVICAIGNPSTTDIGIFQVDQNGINGAGLNGARLTATSTFYISGSYRTEG